MVAPQLDEAQIPKGSQSLSGSNYRETAIRTDVSYGVGDGAGVGVAQQKNKNDRKLARRDLIVSLVLIPGIYPHNLGFENRTQCTS